MDINTPIYLESAAGTVLYHYQDGVVTFALVYRQRYDDWTLPKGHVDPGENLQQTALRETQEETGWQSELKAYLGRTTYEYNLEETQRWRVVEWFLARATEHPNEPDAAEIQAVEWREEAAARAQLTFTQHQDLVEAARLLLDQETD